MNPILEILNDPEEIDDFVFYALSRENLSKPTVAAWCKSLDDDMSQEAFVEFCGSQGFAVVEITPEEARILTSEHDAHVGGHFHKGMNGMEFHQTKGDPL
jgi:hypothetical protein